MKMLFKSISLQQLNKVCPIDSDLHALFQGMTLLQQQIGLRDVLVVS